MIAKHLLRMAPGSRDKGRLTVGTLASGRDVDVPYLLLRGRTEHPCLWVNAAVHGNESQATLTALAFAQRMEERELDGSLVVTPVANPMAFDAREKHAPVDGLDLDQSFGKRSTGFSTERIAERLLAETLDTADSLVNLHTMAPFLDASTYTVYKPPADIEAIAEEELLRLTALCAPAVSCRMALDGPGELPGAIDGALDYQMVAAGRPAFMLEVGSSGAWDEPRVDEAAEGLRHVAMAVGVAPAAGLRAPTTVTRVTRRTHVTCSAGGLFKALGAPGDVVPAGEALGAVFDVYGARVEVVRCDEPLLVIGVRRDPVVHSGDRVGFVALDWTTVEL